MWSGAKWVIRVRISLLEIGTPGAGNGADGLLLERTVFLAFWRQLCICGSGRWVDRTIEGGWFAGKPKTR